MAEIPAILQRGIPPAWTRTALVILGAYLALSIGSAIAHPVGGALLMPGLVAAALVAAYIHTNPFSGFLVLAGSSLFLVVFAVTESRYLNVFDVLLPFMLATTLLGRTRRDAHAGDRLETGPAHDELRVATRSFSQAGLWYFGLAALSLIPMIIRIGPLQALESAFKLTRGFEGALLFPLGLLWIRNEKHVTGVYRAMFVSTVLLSLVSAIHIFGGLTYRAGSCWVINHLDWPLEGANETGAAMLVVWALLLAKHTARPHPVDFVLFAITLLTLVLTQSRSSLLALGIFTLFTIRRVPLRFVVAALISAAIVAALAPPDFWRRMIHTLTFKKGSFEIYSALIRVYGYQANLQVFQHNWLFGVGFMGSVFVSHQYNDLNIAYLGSENFFLESAVGMGVIGLAVVLICYWRLLKLGPVVKRLTPPGSIAHEMARCHVPLMVATGSICMTGSHWIGMVGLAQLCLWCALLVRAAHVALRASGTPAPADAEGATPPLRLAGAPAGGA